MRFTALGLNEATLQGIADAQFTDCTPVQALVLPHSLAGKDVMVQSKTGSGKTAIYLLTIIEKYMKAYLSKTATPAALVVAPTRELAVQIEEDAQVLAAHIPDFRIGCFYGGVGYGEQTQELKEHLSLYVGTPGRLIDFARSHKIDFRMFKTVVLDEADRMFDMGFYPDIRYMFDMMVKPTERQTIILSATLSTKVRNLAWDHMNEPIELESEPEEITVDKIKQELFHVSKDEEFSILLQVLAKLKPKSTLVFTNTKERAVEVSKRLEMNGYKSAYLMGDMKQSDRLKTLEMLKEGKLDMLVATDVAARGLQIDDLELVVNYDLPEDYENYVHRIGRTARAGKEGRAITLASEEYIYSLEAIEEYIHMKIPVCWPDEYGLEEVEDKSAEWAASQRGRRRYSSSNRSGDRRRQGGGAAKGRRRGESSDKRERTEKAGDAARPAKAPKRSAAEYDKLAQMPLSERMKLYKEDFAASEGQKPSQSKKGQGQKRSQGQKPQGQRRPQGQAGQGARRQSPQGKGQGGQRPQGKDAAPKKEGAARVQEAVKPATAAVSSTPQHVSTKPAAKKKSVWNRVVSIFKGGDKT